jgi:hypothetical protein
VVECLLSNHKTLNSNPSTRKRERGERRGEKGRSGEGREEEKRGREGRKALKIQMKC